MARPISNIIELSTPISFEKKQELTFTEQVQTINKIKHGLGILYFIAVSVLLATLFI